MTSHWQLRHRAATTAALTFAVAALMSLLVSLLALTAPFHYVELKAYDTYLSSLATRQDRRTVLVLIDDQTRSAFREPLLLWNRHYADLFRGLAAAGARVVGVDVYFSIPVDPWFAGQDALLSRAYLETAASQTAIVLGYLSASGGASDAPVDAAPVYMPAASQERVGFLNLTQDSDDYIRRQELFGSSKTDGAYAFSVQLAAKFTGRDPADLTSGLAPMLDQRTVRIAYRGRGAFPVVSFVDAVEAARRNDSEFLRRHFAGRAVLIGTDSIEDRHATPTSWTLGTRMNGVEIHANSLATLLDGNPIVPLALSWRFALLLLAAGIVALVTVFRGPLTGAAAGALLVAAVLAAGGALMRRSLFFSPVTFLAGVPLAFAAALSYRVVIEGRDRRRLRRVFAQYVPDRVIDRILARGTEQFAGEQVCLTVLFSDIRDFTHISEELPPHALMAQLNEYFGAMTKAVLAHGGVVDKFIGDGVLALFGAPIRHEDHARRALAAARQMREVLAGLNRAWAEKDRHQFRIGIGLHTGEVVVGNVGSELKVEYTALGNTVNVAARVESATKDFMRESSACILLSEDTMRAIGEVPDAEDLGEQALRGKSQRMRLYRISSAARKAAVEASVR